MELYSSILNMAEWKAKNDCLRVLCLENEKTFCKMAQWKKLFVYRNTMRRHTSVVEQILAKAAHFNSPHGRGSGQPEWRLSLR